MNDGVHTDEWCRQSTTAAAVSIQAHSAPLGLAFFDADSTVTLEYHTYIHTFIYKYICMCVHATCGYAYPNTYIHTFINTYIHTYIRTCIHKNIHTYIHRCGHGGFPTKMDGDAFIALHGSWNRDTPTGFKVCCVCMLLFTCTCVTVYVCMYVCSVRINIVL